MDAPPLRRVSASDALFIASTKGAVAGSVNVTLAFALGAGLPAGPTLLGTLTVGLLGYGISLVLFVLALRGLELTQHLLPGSLQL